MSKTHRLVLDTNILVSALLLENSSARHVVHESFANHIVLMSAGTIEELSIVLRRKKFDKYASIEVREEFLQTVVKQSLLCGITESIQICRDESDNKLLELAVSGNATFLITGDQDLQTLHPYRTVSILSPRQSIEVLSL